MSKTISNTLAAGHGDLDRRKKLCVKERGSEFLKSHPMPWTLLHDMDRWNDCLATTSWNKDFVRIHERGHSSTSIGDPVSMGTISLVTNASQTANFSSA
eukprot:scaffold22562_cov153-Cylindrotheca_fusiformis.AAC.3